MITITLITFHHRKRKYQLSHPHATRHHQVIIRSNCVFMREISLRAVIWLNASLKQSRTREKSSSSSQTTSSRGESSHVMVFLSPSHMTIILSPDPKSMVSIWNGCRTQHPDGPESWGADSGEDRRCFNWYPGKCCAPAALSPQNEDLFGLEWVKRPHFLEEAEKSSGFPGIRSLRNSQTILPELLVL